MNIETRWRSFAELLALENSDSLYFWEGAGIVCLRHHCRDRHRFPFQDIWGEVYGPSGGDSGARFYGPITPPAKEGA